MPSCGLCGGVDSIWVENFSVEYYLECLNLRNAGEDRMKNLLLHKYVRDTDLVATIPDVDLEFLLTSMYVENFSDSVSVSLECPQCNNHISEQYDIPKYDIMFLEPSDAKLFVYYNNGKRIHLKLPSERKFLYEAVDYIDREKTPQDALERLDLEDFTMHVKGEIELNVGIQRRAEIICNECGSTILTRKPSGNTLFSTSPESMMSEKKSIFTIINSFSYAGHMNADFLTRRTYKDFIAIWESFIEMKEKEKEQLDKT